MLWALRILGNTRKACCRSKNQRNKNSVKTFQNLHLSSEGQELGGVPGAFQSHIPALKLICNIFMLIKPINKICGKRSDLCVGYSQEWGVGWGWDERNYATLILFHKTNELGKFLWKWAATGISLLLKPEYSKFPPSPSSAYIRWVTKTSFPISHSCSVSLHLLSLVPALSSDLINLCKSF